MQSINEAERILAEYEQRHLDPPNRKPVYICECCLREIQDGERLWKINDSILCDDCAKNQYSEEVEDY